MANEPFIEIEVRLETTGASAEEIDRLTRRLAATLRETDVERVELARDCEPPDGTKGDGVTLGLIVVTVIPAFIPLVIECVRTWVERQRTGDLRFSGTINGQPIDFSGSQRELEVLVRSLARQSTQVSKPPQSPPP
jgi:hypothetical protein